MTDGLVAVLAFIGIIVLVSATYQWINYLNRRNRDRKGNGS